MGRRIRCWAHRGAGKTAPENTLIAIEAGAQRGFDAVEFDTMPTADGQWVLHHDWTTGRTMRPRSGAADGRRIVSLTADDLAAYEAGSWLAPGFSGEPVPRLADALQLCHRLGLEVNVELKLDFESGIFIPRRLADTAASLLSALKAGPYGVDDRESSRLVVSSFGLPGLYALRDAGYTGRLAPLFESLADDWVAHARDLGAEAVHTHHAVMTPEWVRRIHTTGRPVRVYTVNDAERLAELDAMGVDDAFTDEMAFGHPSPE